MIRQYFENVNFFFFSEKQNKTYAAILIFLIFISSILEFIAISLLALFILFLSGKTELGIIDKFYIPNFITFENYSFFFVIIGFFIFKNIFVSFIEFNKSKYFATLFSKFHRSNMKNFLNLDYNIYKNVKSSEFSKKINFSSERTFIGIGEPGTSLLSTSCVFVHRTWQDASSLSFYFTYDVVLYYFLRRWSVWYDLGSARKPAFVTKYMLNSIDSNQSRCGSVRSRTLSMARRWSCMLYSGEVNWLRC